MGSVDLPHFKQLLLEKRGELSSALGESQSRVPAAGGWESDVIDQANADAEAELHIRLHQTDGRLLRAIEEAYGVCVFCKQPISKARLEAVPWTHVCRECKETRPSRRSTFTEPAHDTGRSWTRIPVAPASLDAAFRAAYVLKLTGTWTVS